MTPNSLEKFEFPAIFQLCLQTNFQLFTRSKSARNLNLNDEILAFLQTLNEIGGKLGKILRCSVLYGIQNADAMRRTFRLGNLDVQFNCSVDYLFNHKGWQN